MQSTKNLLLFSFTLFVYLKTIAQQIPEEKWNEGKIFLKDSSALLGFLNYDFNSQILRLKLNGQLRTFNPFQISGFEFLDPEADTLRTFSVYPFPKTPNYPVDMFFEVLEKGKYSLLAQDIMIADYTEPSPTFNNPRSMGNMMAEDRNIYYRYLRTYYVFDEKKNKFVRLSKPKKYFSSLEAHYTSLKKFIRENKLKPSRERDMRIIIRYLNKLQKT